MIIMLFLLYFILVCHGTFLFSQILNRLICGIFEHNCFPVYKKNITFDFQSLTTSAETNFLLPKPHDHRRQSTIGGSADLGEVYIGSDINRLDSGNILQYTIAPSQCEKLNWNRTWHIMYFYR